MKADTTHNPKTSVFDKLKNHSVIIEILLIEASNADQSQH